MKLPVQVIGMLVGVPKADQQALLDTVHENMHKGTTDCEGRQAEAVLAAAGWFNDTSTGVKEHPTGRCHDPTLTCGVRRRRTGTVRKLRRDEALTFLTLIMSAGSDTTATAIGWAGSLLSAPSRATGARWSTDPPAHSARRRRAPPLRAPGLPFLPPGATKDVEFHGQSVPAETVLVVVPEQPIANETMFEDPDRFDIHRHPGQIFTFSFGAHFCLGASLARMETKIALETILPSGPPEWTVDPESACLTGGIDTRGWEHLPVQV